MNRKDLKERFWLFWGLAPEGSLKYKKGKDTLAFIKNELNKIPCCGHRCCCNLGRVK